MSSPKHPDNTTKPQVKCIIVDYHDPVQMQHLIETLNNYAQDPMGGGSALEQTVKDQLAEALQQRPFAFSVLAYVNGQPAGLANCFEGFSTFKCKPLVNIHDLAVNPSFRGQRVSTKILEEIERIAVERGYCKITLEVLEGNEIAKQAYLKFGFSAYELDPQLGKACFWEKPIGEINDR